VSPAEPAPAFEPSRPATDIIDVAIVGGGAAGLAAAAMAGRRLSGARIVVFDCARRIGAKILVSGGGRCNVTNRTVRASDFWGGDRRFVESVLRAFPSEAAVAYFDDLSVALHEEDDGKLFPDSGQARTVLDALLGDARRHGVEIRTEQRVATVQPAAGGVFTLRRVEGAVDAARAVVLATGGLSLPKSGSDGGGLALAAAFGHRIVPTTPALAPLVLDGTFHRALTGVTHDAALAITVEGARPVNLRGSLLWTHFGVSGPLALDASRHWHRAAVEGRGAAALLSFLPGLDFSAVDRRLLEAATTRPSATLRGTLAEWLPAAVAGAVLDAVGSDPGVRLAHLSRDDRRVLAHALVSWGLPIAGSRGYNYAEATAGGVALDEIDRGTMGSKKCPGLYVIGEMLDVDGRLGGFNFQWAWSSAWVAARGLSDSLQGERRDG
jgi:predicted Rossmann fold flavoprotein